MNESELILGAQRGDEAAFEELVRRYEKKVYNLCLRMCSNADDAADAAQDTFLAVWRGIGSFRQDAAFSTWLYRLASNACIDLIRRNHRAPEGVSLDDEDVHLEVHDTAPTPEQAYESRERSEQLASALAALPEDYRTVLVLRELHQLSYGEIAEVTRLELGTVKSRISRARMLVRNYLSADGNFFEVSASKVTECNKFAERGRDK